MPPRRHSPAEHPLPPLPEPKPGRSGPPVDDRLDDADGRFAKLADAMPQLVWTARDDGTVDYYNRRAALYRGLEQTPGGAWRWQAVVHHEDLDHTIETWRTSVTTGRPYECKHRIQMADGSWRWHISRATRVEDHDGQRRWFGTATDIHSTIETEQALHESEARSVAVLESITDGLITVDGDWRITYINRRGAEIVHPVQPDPERLLGVDFWEAFPDTRGTVIEEQYRLAHRERTSVEFEAFYPPLRSWFGIQVFPTRDGGISIYFLDITDRKRAEEEAGRTAALIEGITKGTEEQIAAQDADYRYIYFNDAYQRTFESLWGKELRLGTSMLEALAEWPEERDKARDLWRRAHAGETFRITMEFGPSDTEKRVFDLRFNPVLDAAGRQIAAAHMIRDVTDQVRTEQELLRSQQQLSAILSQTTAGIAQTDLSGRFTFVNKYFCDLVGRSSEDLADMRMHDITHPDDLPGNAREFEALIRDGAPFVIEKRYVRPDGSHVWVRNNVAPIRDEHGRTTGVLAASVDITDQKLAELVLRESEAHTRRVLDNLFAFVGVLAPDGTLLDANRAPLEAAGIRLDDVRNRKFWDCYWWNYDESVRARVRDASLRAAAGETVRFDVPVRMAGDSRMWIDFQIAPLRDDHGRITHLIPSAMDLTARHAAEAARRESEDRFRTLADNIHQFAWMTDEKGWIFWYNQRWYEFTGTTLEQMQGWGWTDVHHPDHVDRVVARFRTAVETGTPWEDVFPLRGKDGQYRWFLSRALPIRDDEGQIVRWFGTNTDITEQRQAEEALRRSEAAAHQSAVELQAVMDTVPAIVAIAHDPRCTHITGNRAAHEALRVPPDHNLSKTSNDNLAVQALRFFREGRELSAPEMPMQRAARGETVLDEEVEARFSDGSMTVLLGSAVPLLDPTGSPRGAVAAFIDITEHKRHEQQMRSVMGELNHRVKNTLAVVDAVARQTLRRAPDLATFGESFNARLRSIAKAHGLLTNADWKGCPIGEIVRSELEPRVGSPEQLHIEGPDVTMPPTHCLALHMILHELATNASKYGALSSERGRLKVTWTVIPSGDGERVRLEWTEHAPAQISPPESTGYGSRLIQRTVEYELRGAFEREFTPQGLRCRIDFPLRGASPLLPEDPPSSKTGRPNDQASRSVLLVEDNLTLATALTEHLEEFGYSVIGPARTLEAACRLAEQRPAAALLDVDLDGQKVYPFARRLREVGVPFALLTGYELVDLPQDLRDAVVLSKPMDVEEINRFLDASLAGR